MDPPTCHLISGGLHADARGTVAFVNDFDFSAVRRFYIVRNNEAGRSRGWIGHRREDKWFTCAKGTIILAVVRPDDWQSPSSALPIHRFTLDATTPAVLHVPAGHATASLPLTAEALLLVFSSVVLAETKGDDYRFSAETWPVRTA